MPVSEVNGVELYWERSGTGPRLLYCNGSGLTLANSQPLRALFSASFDLLAWDYRGFGQSRPVSGSYSMADVAADMAVLLELSGWDTCIAAISPTSARVAVGWPLSASCPQPAGLRQRRYRAARPRPRVV